MIEIKSLKGVSYHEIEQVFNLAFSDYYLHIHFSKEQLEEKFLSENGSFELSVGAFENKQLVGFILHFFDERNDERKIYNGGTGVIPKMRGQGLSLKMYDYILPILIENKIDKMILEVLTINEPAIRVYKKIGFKNVRSLDCYKGKLIVNPKESKYEVRKIEDYDWIKLQSFWDHEPTWQNSILALNNLKTKNTSLGIYLNDDILGYLVFNPKANRIHQIAIHKNHRQKGLGTQLINEFTKHCDNSVSFINLDTRMSNMDKFLKKCGMERTIQQNEMEFYFDQNQR